MFVVHDLSRWHHGTTTLETRNRFRLGTSLTSQASIKGHPQNDLQSVMYMRQAPGSSMRRLVRIIQCLGKGIGFPFETCQVPRFGFRVWSFSLWEHGVPSFGRLAVFPPRRATVHTASLCPFPAAAAGPQAAPAGIGMPKAPANRKWRGFSDWENGFFISSRRI